MQGAPAGRRRRTIGRAQPGTGVQAGAPQRCVGWLQMVTSRVSRRSARAALLCAWVCSALATAAAAVRSTATCEELSWESKPATPEVCAASTIEGSCYGNEEWNFTTALSVCTSAGARLCTLLEAVDDVARSTGCSLNKDNVWVDLLLTCTPPNEPAASGHYLIPTSSLEITGAENAVSFQLERRGPCMRPH